MRKKLKFGEKMNKIHKYRERVLIGNTQKIIERAAEHGLDKDSFIQKVATCEMAFLDKSATILLEMMGTPIPQHLIKDNGPKIIKKTEINTEIICLNITEAEYDKLCYAAREHSFTARGGVGLFLDKIACFEVVFKIINFSKLKKIGGKNVKL